MLKEKLVFSKLSVFPNLEAKIASCSPFSRLVFIFLLSFVNFQLSTCNERPYLPSDEHHLLCLKSNFLVKSETEITKDTRRKTLSLSDDVTFCSTVDKDIMEENQKPSVPSENDPIVLCDVGGGEADLEETKEDLKSPVSEMSSSSGSYSVTTDGGRGEGERGEEAESNV